jgi:hypothetical protein
MLCAWTSALQLARQGVPIFPCRPDKAPLIKNGFKGATTNFDKLHQWWTRWPDALVSVPTGERFVVVDVDLQHTDALVWLEENRRRLPPTRTHATRSGGKHLLFKRNDKIRCSTSKLGPHVDTKGDGGCIVWWPAHGFEVLHGGVLAHVPEWTVEALNPKPQPIVTRFSSTGSAAPTSESIRGALQVLARAREGERNHCLFWVSCRLGEAVRARTITEGEALDLVLAVGRQVGLLDQEILRTARSGLREVLQ